MLFPSKRMLLTGNLVDTQDSRQRKKKLSLVEMHLLKTGIAVIEDASNGLEILHLE